MTKHRIYAMSVASVLLVLLVGCATAGPKSQWIEQNSIRGLVLTQSITAGSDETFLVCRTLENIGPRRAYILGGIEHRISTAFYAIDGMADAPDTPGHSSRVPPPYPGDASSFTELGVNYRVNDCGRYRYDGAHTDVFVVQAEYESPLLEGAELPSSIVAAIEAGTNEAPLLRTGADILYSNRCRVDRVRKVANCDASLAG